ncbi:MAG: alanine--tRNA ligase [Cyclobacteriaceae bacterium]|nr:alanine--tRNA ligase [Cyclobacteriaceae bacterium SS2]
MNSQTIREKFLSFFNSKDHQIVPSAPIVVQNDPTLMFTNAGMNQFKDYFLGNSTPESARVADTQKCLRVSGKHNDLEEVGLDTYHHTMFEMLGNWSFGVEGRANEGYFKKEAIDWAWELLTEVFSLDKTRMYATVFEGDTGDNLEADEEARGLWSKFLPADHILNGNKKDNFWEMGETGPCGPCSEIHIDIRSEEEIKKIPGRDLVNKDHPQVIEIWNLVFIQFNRMADGKLKTLPQKHVDTGMGFERLAMVVQGKTSNYDTDVFQPLIQEVANKANLKYGKDEKTDIALRVIADHIRAVSFTIADGQLPSNMKAGYVIRRILRRAVRYGYTFLKFEEPFLFSLVRILADQYKDVFPELKAQEEFVTRVVKEEETAFLRTLDKGLKRIDAIKSQTADKEIDGKTAFELYDTYGFPLDLTSLIARETGFTVDEKGFEVEMQNQKSRSKTAAKQSLEDWVVVLEQKQHSAFVGYDEMQSSSKIIRYREVKRKDDVVYQLILDKTPFYAESGGQVGDKGVLSSENETIPIFDTKKENDLIIHFTKKLPKDPRATFTASVDRTRRTATQRNHSATHLLHAALRHVLGDHVQQRGSLVNDEVLRFDFSHFSKMTNEEIKAVEEIANQKILENVQLDEQRSVPIEEAKKMGAMALFGEKYGDLVRVITFDKNFSVELCGGTHVAATGSIGLLKIVAESSVAAGVRRIEALTGDAARQYLQREVQLLDEVRTLLKHPKDVIKSVASLIEEKGQLQKNIEEINLEKAKSVKQDLKADVRAANGANVILKKVTVPNGDALKQLSFELKQEIDNLVLILAADVDQKPLLSVMFADTILNKHDLNASEMVRLMAKEIQGGGGGQPFYATAGGKNLAGLDKSLEIAKQYLKEKAKIEF